MAVPRPHPRLVRRVALAVAVPCWLATVLACTGDINKNRRKGKAGDAKQELVAADAAPGQGEAADKGAGGAKKEGGPAAKTLPAEQAAFVEKVESFYEPYRSARNELKKSALRAERRAALQAVLPERKAAGWVGTLRRTGTNSEGKAHMEIRLAGAKSVAVKTWNNALSDVGDQTLIEGGSAVYKALAELSERDEVVFSGEFVPADRDYIRESSLTERGSMTEPAFIIRVTEIRKR